MLVPAIHFPGTCQQAINRYKEALNAQVINIAYERDAPSDSNMHANGTPDHVMHAELIIAGTRLNMCDVNDDVTNGNMHLYNIFMDSIDEVRTAYEQLTVGGKIHKKIGPQFWTSMYCDIEDAYGVRWQIMTKE
ncbi:MAG: hypothetical protein GX096_14025 [Clostridiales bacterium]|nr:hypothetical protein [Clostridiales bacterium]